MNYSLRPTLLLCVCCVSAPILPAADNADNDNEEPQPIPTAADAAPGMSLELYRSLKTRLQALEQPAAAEPAADTILSEDGEATKKEPTSPAAAHAAARALAEAGLRAEVGRQETNLLAALESARTLQREIAARALGFSANRDAVRPALIEALRHDAEYCVRSAAAAALGQLGDAHAADALIDGLADNNEEVRAFCCAALGAMRDDKAMPQLLLLLRSESNTVVRLQAALAAGRLASKHHEAELAALLDSERDERVRMVLAAAVRASTGQKLDDVPQPNEYFDKLTAITTDMRDMERKLRDDRHDDSVQIDGDNADRKLSDLINELENMNQRQSQNEQKNEKNKKRMASMSKQRGQQQPANKANKKGGDGGSDSAVNPNEVVARHERWAALPTKDREELLQVFRPEVPPRWRKRLEAYFVSLAAEEANYGNTRTNDKPAPAANEDTQLPKADK